MSVKTVDQRWMLYTACSGQDVRSLEHFDLLCLKRGRLACGQTLAVDQSVIVTVVRTDSRQNVSGCCLSNHPLYYSARARLKIQQIQRLANSLQGER